MVPGFINRAPFRLNVSDKVILYSNDAKLLGITIDNVLKLKKHIEHLCKKAYYKLHVLRRIRGYSIDKKTRRILANVFIDNQFKYAPLIWMFAGKR